MKRFFLPIVLILIFLLAGCGTGSSNSTANNTKTSTASQYKNVFEIKEKMFIAQCNDIYLNTGEYLDKMVKLEGIYNESFDPQTNKTYCYVIRHGPGCCGNDGVAGFEVIYNGTSPKPNDWVEAIGKVAFVDENGKRNVVLKLVSLEVLDTRGAEFVRT